MMNDEQLDAYLLSKDFVMGSYEELEELLEQCPNIIRTRYDSYGERYYKYILISVSLRSWTVWIPAPDINR